jgi:hypothetical protein
MKRVLLLVLCVLLLQVHANASTKAAAPTTQRPAVMQIIGSNADAKLGPALYPSFTNFTESSNAPCQQYLEQKLSLAPICTRSQLGSGFVGGTCTQDFSPIEGLKITNLAVPEAYRTSAKILIAWTVRIEGYSKGYSITPEFCSNWSGTLTERFPKGKVKTALYVDGKMYGHEIIMEPPEASMRFAEDAPPPPPSSGFNSDPTLIGTYVLKASDMPGGKFPAMLKLIEIRWKNETSMDIVSPKNMRTILLNFLPVTKQVK